MFFIDNVLAVLNVIKILSSLPLISKLLLAVAVVVAVPSVLHELKVNTHQVRFLVELILLKLIFVHGHTYGLGSSLIGCKFFGVFN